MCCVVCVGVRCVDCSVLCVVLREFAFCLVFVCVGVLCVVCCALGVACCAL